jgi:hypothetical protein
MLQFYPPYKNLDPEIPRKQKREGVTTVFNDLHKHTMIFFLKEVDPR